MCFREHADYHTIVKTRGQLSSTHWSVVLAARDSDPGRARAALAGLCEKYWPALYAYLRRKGYPAEQAKDLMQGFFAHFLEADVLGRVSPEKGRFRAFLITCLNHFLADEWDRAHAQKRGGQWIRLSLDDLAPYEPATDVRPETAFDRQWAHSLLDGVLDHLRAEYARAGKTALFEALCPYLTGPAERRAYLETGKRLGLSEGAVKVAVHRLRKRYCELIRQEVAHTLGEEEDDAPLHPPASGGVEGELRYLLSVL